MLVKALPRPSRKYQETVCCAGVTEAGEWRRLFPVRFRQLTQTQQFDRWQWVSYGARRPSDDRRMESRRIEENTLRTGTKEPARSRLQRLLPLLRASTNEAAARNESLTLLEPSELQLRARRKPIAAINAELERYREAARQGSLLDPGLAEMKPCPFAVQITFKDDDGNGHSPLCGDWETSAAFFNLARGMSEHGVIEHLRKAYTERSSEKRIFLALGTVKARPSQWLLLGVLRVTEPKIVVQRQFTLAF
ncbi:hypothetical protein [Roseomonas elaeocarpi]|uniref:Uncharacterized protein n=1 Tax=Roseomonas elaeocarpi TaxID=907779 RepID=A0ABV6JXB9_9PROT